MNTNDLDTRPIEQRTQSVTHEPCSDFLCFMCHESGRTYSEGQWR